MNQGQPGALATWDETADLLWRHGWRIVSVYCIGCLPFAAVALVTLDACLAGRREDLPWLCLGLVAAGYARWLGGALAQRRAAQALDGGQGPTVLPYLARYFRLRLCWQGQLAGPAALDGSGARAAMADARRARRAARGFYRALFLGGIVFWMVGVAQLVVVQYFLVDMLLPFLFGWDDPLLKAVLFGRFWLMALLFFSLLGFEFFWLVAGVVAYRRSASRWTGADLAARIREMGGKE